MATISAQMELTRPRWQTIIIFSLAFWLSGSLILDLVIMPSLYLAGMMTTSGFAMAGNLIFWAFNRVELICAALSLTGLMVLHYSQTPAGQRRHTAIILSLILLGIALINTYALAPQMSALGIQLNLFDPATEVPATMNLMHQGYFTLELIKLAAGSILLGWCCRNQA